MQRFFFCLIFFTFCGCNYDNGVQRCYIISESTPEEAPTEEPDSLTTCHCH